MPVNSRIDITGNIGIKKVYFIFLFLNCLRLNNTSKYTRDRNKYDKQGNSVTIPAYSERKDYIRKDWMKIRMSGIFGGGGL